MANKKKNYNSMVMFERPILYDDGTGTHVEVYGLLYNNDEKHKDDLWIFELNSYICYLIGIEKAMLNGCEIYPDHWVSPNGKTIDTTNGAVKEFIYKKLRDSMISYRLIESGYPLMYDHETETDNSFIISKGLFNRYGLTDETRPKKVFSI